ncbi:prolyl oligopeptidase family serine peptidase, partial [Streptococcus sp. DD11]
MNSRYLKLSAVAAVAALAAACGSRPRTSNAIDNISIGIQGYEFGPAVSKVILNLKEPVSSLDTSKAKLLTAGVERAISKSYLSDAEGKAVKEGQSSDYATLELQVNYSFEDPSGNASPFHYNLSTLMNEWAPSYPVSVNNLVVDHQQALSKEADAINHRVSAELAAFTKRDSYSGSYTNPLTQQKEKLTLNYAAYEPKQLKKGAKNPLLIWLHGQGEGGTDTDITLLGNEVTALVRDDIQQHFTAADDRKESGAYVLAVQTPTYWMDEGDGTNGAGAGVSRYTEILMDTIKAYVQSNPDIDSSRIYLAGCSNGGYMTLNLALHYPDYFAALVPQATAYSYYSFERNPDGTYKKTADQTAGSAGFVKDGGLYFDEEKIKTLSALPIWFVHAANDQIVQPSDYALPVYKALVDSGADNKWFSYYESVPSADVDGVDYLGHWSWIYFFN